ncbi:unnamed protein product [Ostreobium quekettii]|uniref:Signal recognition particle subunit SRP72 n=1 Tax=Ostreobium quekettii TaxID=121088 RepID=A0A8S1JCQ7_9CHLO|nr:unnamed protein product [Ostreobium quekettii]|eukprot:evm.model.scf_1875.1 EVM.evm.TU.scf_1875.1   scf_1875:8807-17661(+)
MADKAREQQLHDLFSKLDKFLQNAQYKRALKKTEEILQISKEDEDALRCKVYALIQLSQFDEAVKVLKGKVGQQLSFEKAYCLYRLGHYQEALVTVAKVTDDRRQARLELEGQLHYVMGNHQKAVKVYQELRDKLKVESSDIKTNMIAPAVAGNMANELKGNLSAATPGGEGFELAFNKACGLLHTGDVKGAQQQIELARREGEESLYSYDYTEEQVEAELLPVSVQLGYVSSLLGDHKAAVEAYTRALGVKGGDASSRTVAENNMLSETSRSQPEQPQRKFTAPALKKLETSSEGIAGDRLSSIQRCTILCNRAILYIKTGRAEQAKGVIASLAKDYPDSEIVNILKATVLARDKKISEAHDLLKNCTLLGNRSTLDPLLMRVQLLAANGLSGQAANLIDEVPTESTRNQGAIVATHAALLERSGDQALCEDLVSKALTWWNNQDASDGTSRARSTSAAWCLDYLARLKLKSGSIEEAVKLYQEVLVKELEEVQRAEVMSKVSRVLAITDPCTNATLESGLPGVPKTGPDDVDKLESGVKGTSGERRGEELKKRANEGDDADKPKKRRKRKIRLPKNFDPQNPGPMPDPERWLPKWQRAGYKKRRRRREDHMKGSQGAGKVDDTLDRARQQPEPSTSSRSQPRQPPRPAGGRRRGGRRS